MGVVCSFPYADAVKNRNRRRYGFLLIYCIDVLYGNGVIVQPGGLFSADMIAEL
jgi:hypothetical protein